MIFSKKWEVYPVDEEDFVAFSSRRYKKAKKIADQFNWSMFLENSDSLFLCNNINKDYKDYEVYRVRRRTI